MLIARTPDRNYFVEQKAGYCAWWYETLYDSFGYTTCDSIEHGQQLADAAHREWVAQFLTPWEPVLRWEGHEGYAQVAKTPFGDYTIRQNIGDPTWYWQFSGWCPGDKPTEMEVKAACQADYAARWEAAK